MPGVSRRFWNSRACRTHTVAMMTAPAHGSPAVSSSPGDPPDRQVQQVLPPVPAKIGPIRRSGGGAIPAARQPESATGPVICHHAAPVRCGHGSCASGLCDSLGLPVPCAGKPLSPARMFS